MPFTDKERAQLINILQSGGKSVWIYDIRTYPSLPPYNDLIEFQTLLQQIAAENGYVVSFTLLTNPPRYGLAAPPP